MSNPSPLSAVVSQCHAFNRSGAAAPKAFLWLSKTSSASLASNSGSLIRPRLSCPSW